jgi:hypothetical protein
MIKTIVSIDKKCSMVVILYLFFSIFFLGNGIEKYVNGEMIADSDPNIAKYALRHVDTGEIVYRAFSYRIHDGYGSNRNAKFRAYFDQSGLSYETSQFFLYLISVIEIILGLVFLYLFIRSLSSKDQYNRTTLFGTRTLHRLAFKAGTLMFVAFLIADLYWGDRWEVFEHSLYFLFMLYTYSLFLQSDRIQKVEAEQIKKGWEGERNRRKERDPNYKGVDRRGSQIDHGHH